MVVKILQLRQREFAKRDKIFDLYKNTVFDQCIFREVIGQFCGGISVATIYRGYC